MAEPPHDLSPILAGGPRLEVPLELWSLHHALEVGARVVADAASIGTWPAPLLRAVMAGAGFEPVPRRRGWTRAHTLADTVGPGMRVLLAGLNPSVYSADVGAGFARPGNRFWPAAIEAGLVSVARDPLAALESHGVGMTDLVKRATARADQLEPSEYRTGVDRLRHTVAWLEPRILCVVGLTGWRLAVDRRAGAGMQDAPFGGRPVYVMPNPSGLNAHVTVHGLADHFRAVQRWADANPA